MDGDIRGTVGNGSPSGPADSACRACSNSNTDKKNKQRRMEWYFGYIKKKMFVLTIRVRPLFCSEMQARSSTERCRQFQTFLPTPTRDHFPTCSDHQAAAN